MTSGVGRGDEDDEESMEHNLVGNPPVEGPILVAFSLYI
jgi:hypothetical protein